MNICITRHPSKARWSTSKPAPSSGRCPGLLTRVGIALFFVLSVAGCRSIPSTPSGNDSPERYVFAQAQMGLEFRMTLHAQSEVAAETAAAAAFARIAELNAVLSDYDADSELSRLSQASGSGRWTTVSRGLWRVIAAGQLLANESGGAFDLTIGPSVNLWRRARRQQELPEAALLERMQARVGYQYVELDATRQAVRLTQSDMRLDAGGIAKGFAMDEALIVLRAHGINRAMIQGGGDLRVGDPPPGLPGWRIELTQIEPDGTATPGRPPALSLANCALATSGDLFQFIEIGGVRYSHIVDPRTGVGLTIRRLVHVIAPDGLTADSLSTAISVLGSEAGLALAGQRDGVAARITRLEDGRQGELDSPGFRKYLAPSTRR